MPSIGGPINVKPSNFLKELEIGLRSSESDNPELKDSSDSAEALFHNEMIPFSFGKKDLDYIQ